MREFWSRKILPAEISTEEPLIVKKNISPFFVLSFVAYIAILGSACRADEVPRAVFPETSFFFGNISQGQPLIHTFFVFNRGHAPLKIERVRPG